MELTMWLLFLTLTAQAITIDSLMQRVHEVAPLRGNRLALDAPKVTEEVYRSAASGDVSTGVEKVPGYVAKKVYGVGIVDVPIGRFWAAINDDVGKAEVTRLAFAEQLEGRPCAAKRRVFQYLSVSMASDRWWVVNQTQNTQLHEQSEGRVRELYWESVEDAPLPTATTQEWSQKGIPVVFTRGAWLLIDIDGASTLVEYYAWADPGGYLPAGLASTFAAGTIDNTLETMTGLARSGPRCPIE